MVNKKNIENKYSTQKKDNLNQWRGYADKIPAYCIGFDYEKLKELVMSNDKEMAFENAEVYKPIFDLLDNVSREN